MLGEDVVRVVHGAALHEQHLSRAVDQSMIQLVVVVGPGLDQEAFLQRHAGQRNRDACHLGIAEEERIAAEGDTVV